MVDEQAVARFVSAVSSEPVGEPEAHVSQAIITLVNDVGITVASQVRGETHPVIPDFAIMNGQGLISGYIEVKQPAVDIAPDSWRATTHNGRQWRYLRQLDNVFYTNGLEWVLYQRGVESGRWRVDGSGGDVSALLARLRAVITHGLQPVSTAERFLSLSVPVALEMSRATGKLMAVEQSGAHRPKLGNLLKALKNAGFSGDSNESIADVVVQTYVFALVIAAHDYGLDVTSDSGVYREVVSDNDPLLGAVLGMVSSAVTDGTGGEVSELVRQLKAIVSATDWPTVEGNAGKMLSRYLFEDFLGEFNSETRDKTGSYYTPQKLVYGMVNLVAEVSAAYGKGLADSVVVDPAVGTGTFPLEMVDRVAEGASAAGEGAVAHEVQKFLSNMHGWEMQVTPYAIAASSLRAKAAVYGAEPGAHLMIRDSLRNPAECITDEQLSLLGLTDDGWTLGSLAQAEDEFGLRSNVDIIGGNPPYDATNLEAVAPWAYAQVAEWRKAAKGQGSKTISNLYTAFIRAMCWQAWKKPGTEDSGIVYFVAPSSWLKDKGGAGIRAWIREQASRVWVVDITPEGWMSPGNPFPISTPVAVVVMQRDKGKKKNRQAVVKYRSVTKNSAVDQRLDELCEMSIHDDGWTVASGDEFVPVAQEWLENPTVSDVFLASSAGAVWNRKWAIAPSEKVLHRRIDTLNNLPDEEKPGAFTANRDSSWDTVRLLAMAENISDAISSSSKSFAEEGGVFGINAPEVCTLPLVSGFALGDTRAMEVCLPDLWGSSLQPNNLFVCTANAIKQGASVHTTDLVPQNLMFTSGSERVHPTYQPDGRENTAPGLVEALTDKLGMDVAPNDVAAYITAVTAFSGYRERFEEELSVPTIRVPFTSDPTLWERAVSIGQRIIALSTADRMRLDTDVCALGGVSSAIVWEAAHGTDPIGGRLNQWVKLHDGNKLVIGGNVFTGVTQDILNYRIGNAQIVKKWLERRLSIPYGKSMSPLDKIMPDEWEPEWSVELFKLLQTIEALIAIEGEQQELLDKVVAGELLTRGALEKAGVTWPGDIKDPLRKAHWPDEEQPVGGLFD